MYHFEIFLIEKLKFSLYIDFHYIIGAVCCNNCYNFKTIDYKLTFIYDRCLGSLYTNFSNLNNFWAENKKFIHNL